MAFSKKWIDLVLRCIKPVSYAFEINGELSNIIFPSRGLRQGDPLSPYIYVLCTQGFSSLLKNYHAQGLKKDECLGLGIRVRMARCGPTITHLFFWG